MTSQFHELFLNLILWILFLAGFCYFSPKAVASKIAANSALSSMLACRQYHSQLWDSQTEKRKESSVEISKQRSRSIQCVWWSGRKGHVDDCFKTSSEQNNNDIILEELQIQNCDLKAVSVSKNVSLTQSIYWFS